MEDNERLLAAQSELDVAEDADDERRLKVLEDLHGALEAELERPEFAPQQT
ncbi:MAG: hypothetical protein QOG54_678 [Actinomycetota bacterium]|nr:hypothetical protein [Actinomycetota bacterium]